MSLAQPVLPPRNDGDELLMGVIGVGTVWVTLASILFLALGYPLTPMGYGTVLVHTLVPTILVVGVTHEFLGHYLVAEKYCHYEAAFVAFGTTLGMTLASLVGAVILIILDMFTGLAIPTWVLAFAAVSPGAVLVTATRGRINCHPTIALTAPVFNFLMAFGIWWGVYGGSPVIPSPSMAIEDAFYSYTLLGSAAFALVNAIPVAMFDGAEAFWEGGIVHKGVTIGVIAGSLWILGSYS